MKKLYRLNFMHTDTGPGQEKNLLPYQEGDYRFLERLDEWLSEKMLHAIGRPPVSIKLWNNREIGCGTANPVARIKIMNRTALLTLLSNPVFYFGELFSAGMVDIEGSLPDFLDTVYRHLPARNMHPWLSAVLRKTKNNSQEDARRNIHHHYDIGNEF